MSMVFTVHNSWFVFRLPRSGSRCRPGKSKRPTVRSGLLSTQCQREWVRDSRVFALCVFCVLCVCDDGRGDKGCRHDDGGGDDDDAVYRSRRTSVVHAERGASSVSSSNRGKSLDDDKDDDKDDDDASVDEVGDDVSGRSASCRHEGDLDYDDDDDGRGAKGTGGAVRTETSTRDERVDDGGDRGRSGGTREGGVDER